VFEPLTDRQRAVLDALLQFDHPGVEDLRRQAASARVRPSCACGCPSIGFEVDPQVPQTQFASIWPFYGWREEGPLEVILFVNNGRLVDMELVTFDGETPSEWPDAAEFVFSAGGKPPSDT
jgi:hypothetical protein